MLKELKARLFGIVRNEDGAALVVTLAVFFFMYLLIAGVYAVGMSVKNRIHLQNACDAAAYSAAVVQADTLSRIATINRAMSWTYVQMTRRQMDYIVYKWLKHAYGHFRSDRAVAEAWHSGSPIICPEGHGFAPNGWFIGVDGQFDKIKLNGWRTEFAETIGSHCQYFNNRYMNEAGNRDSFYAASGAIDFGQLGSQIDADRKTIEAMNFAERDLASKLKDRIKDGVEEVLLANVPDEMRSRSRFYVEYCQNPLLEGENKEGYLENLHDNDDDELRLAWFGGERQGSIRDVFKTGINTWYVHAGSKDGVERKYRQFGNTLSATWTWWSAKWACKYIPPTKISPGYWIHPHIDYSLPCPHPGCVDTCVKSGRNYTARLRAGDLHDDRYDGANARPLVMTQAYFGKAGTITVGLAMKNENPWLSLLGAGGVAQGIYSAFNPYHECEWSWAFASAKAGYKRLGEEWKPETVDGAEVMSREYYIDWKPGSWSSSAQSWNLCQSDWDAVLIPVRCAESQATSGAWVVSDDTTGHLAEYVVGDWKDLGAVGVVDIEWSQMKAGGTKELADADQYAQRFDELHAVTTDFDGSGEVEAEWQIGNRNAQLDWEQLANWMRH